MLLPVMDTLRYLFVLAVPMKSCHTLDFSVAFARHSTVRSFVLSRFDLVWCRPQHRLFVLSGLTSVSLVVLQTTAPFIRSDWLNVGFTRCGADHNTVHSFVRLFVRSTWLNVGFTRCGTGHNTVRSDWLNVGFTRCDTGHNTVRSVWLNVGFTRCGTDHSTVRSFRLSGLRSVSLVVVQTTTPFVRSVWLNVGFTRCDTDHNTVRSV